MTSPKPTYEELEKRIALLESARGSVEPCNGGKISSFEELQKRELQFRELVESSSDWIWEVDADGVYTYASPRVVDLLGYEPGEIVGKRPFDLMPSEESRRVYSVIAPVMAAGKPFSGLENINRHKDGRLLCLETSGVPVLSADGKLLGYRGIDRDITQRKQTEEQLRQALDRLRLHVEESPLAVIEWGPDFSLSHWNKEAEQVFGWKAEEVLGRKVEELPWVFEEDADQVRRVSEGLLTGSRRRSVSVNRNYRKDGSIVFCEWYNSSLLDDSGKLISILSFVLDVTDQKRAQDDLKESEQLLRLAVNTARLAIWDWNLADDTVRWHKASDNTFGSPVEKELSFQWWMDHIHPEDRENVLAELQQALRGNDELLALEYRFLQEDGNGRTIYDRFRILRDRSGNPKRVIGAAMDITDLRQTESKFRSLFEISPDAVFLTTPDGGVVAANPAASAIFGWTEQEFRNIDRSGILDTGDSSLAAAIVERRLTGRIQRQELSAIRRNGERFPVEIDSVILPGEPNQSFVIMRDISARKKAERELRESEERLSLALDSGQMGLWEWDVQAHKSMWNAKEYELLGIPSGDGREPEDRFFQSVHPEDRSALKQSLTRIMEEGTDWKHECRIIRPDGQLRWLASIGRVFRGGDDRVRWMIGVNYDITERKRAEERAQLLSEVTAQLLASNQPQQIVDSLCRKVLVHLDCHVFFNFLVDEKKGCLHLNAYAGISEEAAREIESLDFGVAVSGCAARDVRTIVAEGIPTAFDERTRLVRSCGVRAYAAHPLMIQGQVIGTLSFGSRTKSYFSEEDLGLMKTVADHVAIAIQRVRLIESLNEQARVAEAANQAKSQFLAKMSHELRTPMNAILGMIDVALPKAGQPVVRNCLKTAKESADLLRTLLDDLLDSARIESGKLELESSPFSLRRMLDQIVRILSIRANEKGLLFSCRIPDESPDAVVGDRTRLQQVLIDLAGNAIKFTDRGEVEISLRPVVQNGLAALEFFVRDTGIGIPASRLDHIFEPFVQADASTTRRFGGTGLGLAISQSLVEMMGGTIRVESEAGKGSRFHFRIQLPLAEELPPDFEVPLSLEPEPQRQLRILLVEDNPANRELARYVLQERGHFVEDTVDGRKAVLMAAQNHYDVILMDVQMPGMDGFEATAEIRNRESSTARVPIIAMTAHAMKEDRDRCIAAGMDGYLAKPVNRLEMISLIEKLASEVASAPHVATTAFSHTGTSVSQKTAIFDPEEALARCVYSKQMMQEMIRYFLEAQESILADMRSALEKGDLLEVGRLGHYMKGTLVYLGAEHAKEAALRVEQYHKSGSGTPSDALEAVNTLERECSVLKTVLIDYLNAKDSKT